MPKRERDVRDVVDDVHDILAQVEPELSIDACLTVLADLLANGMSADDLRHIIEEARDNQGYQ